LKLIIMMMFL